ncbi:MAG TPA: hypothetical protein PL124_07495 [Candidatus Cloacimonadota bacterium]|nr:hypothetical protein [Candidatus Cloacimonadota bacterium]HPS39241.1 hypothetical protein [Candidatus Cloacimonadota bacterium]
MATIQEIMASPGYLSPFSGNRYRVVRDRIVFGQSMAGKTVVLVCKIADPKLTVDTLPERFQLAATYWVLHRHYSETDANKSSYYHDLYSSEWMKTRHQRTGTPLVNLGDRF